MQLSRRIVIISMILSTQITCMHNDTITLKSIRSFIIEYPIIHATWNPQHPILATSSNKLVLRDNNTGKIKKVISERKSDLPIHYSPNGSRLIHAPKHKCDEDYDLILYNGITGEQIKNLFTQRYQKSNICTFSPDSLEIVQSITKYYGNGSTFIIYDAVTGNNLREVLSETTINTLVFKNNTDIIDNDKGNITCALFSAAYSRLATASAKTKNSLVLRDSEGDLIQQLKTSNTVLTLSFSPDNKHLASGGSSKSITIWDAKNGEKIKSIKTKAHTIDALIFTPYTNILIAACPKDVVLYDSTTYKHLVTLDNATFLALSPDGTYMATQMNTKENHHFVLWRLCTQQNINAQGFHKTLSRSHDL